MSIPMGIIEKRKRGEGQLAGGAETALAEAAAEGTKCVSLGARGI